MKKVRTCAGLFALVMALSVVACAAVPPMINYQGKLLGADGAPLADGAYTMQFAIYALPAGGTALWSETNPAVQVKGGLFSVLLGSVVNLPANLFDSPDRFFGVKVGDDPEMAPRQRIVSTAYAFTAERAALAETVADGAITTDKLAAGLTLQAPTLVGGTIDGPTSVLIDTIGEKTPAHGVTVGGVNLKAGIAYPDGIVLGPQGMTAYGNIKMGVHTLFGLSKDMADDTIYTVTPSSPVGWGIIYGRNGAYPIHCIFFYGTTVYSEFIQFMSYHSAFAGLQNTAITSVGQCTDGKVTLSCKGGKFYICNRYGRTVSLGIQFFGN